MLTVPGDLVHVPRSGFQEDVPQGFARDQREADQPLFSQIILFGLITAQIKR